MDQQNDNNIHRSTQHNLSYLPYLPRLPTHVLLTFGTLWGVKLRTKLQRTSLGLFILPCRLTQLSINHHSSALFSFISYLLSQSPCSHPQLTHPFIQASGQSRILFAFEPQSAALAQIWCLAIGRIGLNRRPLPDRSENERAAEVPAPGHN